MPSYRAERISQQIHQQVSIMLEREMADPRLAGTNITHVQMSGDLRIAKIFVAPNRAGEQATREMMDGLAHAQGYIRRQIAGSLDLRFAPEIRFLLDHAIEKGEHFLRVLDELHAEEPSPSHIPTKGRRRKADRR
jgi:ribosome-binding factor A